MRIFGKIATLRRTPVYLGHAPGDPHHVCVLCDEKGEPYSPTQLAEANIADSDIADMFEIEAEHIAKLLGRSIDHIGLRLTQGEPPAIIDFDK